MTKSTNYSHRCGQTPKTFEVDREREDSWVLYEKGHAIGEVDFCSFCFENLSST